MKQVLVLVGSMMAWASGAAAHPGTHVHPHDGSHWLVMAGALACLALAGRLAMVRMRARG